MKAKLIFVPLLYVAAGLALTAGVAAILQWQASQPVDQAYSPISEARTDRWGTDLKDGSGREVAPAR